MQTFLPYSDFEETAKCLDYRRLGKQRVEAYQLLMGMWEGENFAWKNHPAFKMWNGYDVALVTYGLVICEEWVRRGYKDSMWYKFYTFEYPYNNFELPDWLGDPNFHASHRSNLLRKYPEYYKRFEWKEENNLDYVWPIK